LRHRAPQWRNCVTDRERRLEHFARDVFVSKDRRWMQLGLIFLLHIDCSGDPIERDQF
jgi:hypothetical protein